MVLGMLLAVGYFTPAIAQQQIPPPTLAPSASERYLAGISCPIDKCLDYAERLPMCNCDLKEFLVRDPFIPRFLIPAKFKR